MDKELRQYRIPFVSLKNGIHYFNYEVSKSFFEHFENSPIKESNLNVFVTFEKKVSHFYLKFDIEGTVETNCDRCLKKMDLPVEYGHNIYVKFDDSRHESTNDDPDIVYINPSDTHIDLVQLIYEFSVLSLPIKKNCENAEPVQKCNKEVLEKLDKKRKETGNKEDKTDPRWDSLKKINFK